MLQFSKFAKSYGQTVVLRIDELIVPDGIFWIKGANGSGKSTLLKAAAGILGFDGDVIVDGQTSVKKNPTAYRRLVNFAEAEPVFPPFLTGMEMINLFRSSKGGGLKQHEYFVESMEMTPWIGEPIGTYSSGMVKKLSLLLAFMGKPKFMLLDEPLITIDTASLVVLYRWIEHHHRQEGISFLLSSHQPLQFAEKHQVGVLEVRDRTISVNPTLLV